MKMFNTYNSSLIKAERNAGLLNTALYYKEKGNSRVFVINAGTHTNSFFYPVSNSERYIQSLKDSNKLPASDMSIQEYMDLYI